MEDQRRLKKGIEMDVERQARKKENLTMQLQQQVRRGTQSDLTITTVSRVNLISSNSRELLRPGGKGLPEKRKGVWFGQWREI